MKQNQSLSSTSKQNYSLTVSKVETIRLWFIFATNKTLSHFLFHDYAQ